jgi:pilus assembly protein CpaE
MSKLAQAATQSQDDEYFDEDEMGEAASAKARPIPRISIQAFCEDQRLASVLQEAAEDRRLSKAHVSTTWVAALPLLHIIRKAPRRT